MAAQFILNNYLDQVLAINDANVRVALNNQGLNSLEDFITLSEDDISDICSNARKPGGVIPNPNFRRNAALPATIPNPGVLIGHVHERRLKMLRFYLLHLKRVQRDFDDAIATLDMLGEIYKMKDLEDEEEDIDLPDKLSSVQKVRVVLENIDDYLMRKRGATGVPLAYVVRDDVNLPPIDPGFGLPSYIEEMIRRAPHVGTDFQADNYLVWDMIRHVTHEGPGWNWVQTYQRDRNGRAAYLAVKTHYLGESFTARTRANADHLMENTFFDGKSRTFTFERYCEVLQGAFTDLDSTKEAVSEARKVRVFLNNISDTRLSQAVSQVLATPSLKATFDSAVNFIAQFLDEKKSYSTKAGQRAISSTTTTRPTGHGGRGQGRGSGRGGRFGGRQGRGGRSSNTGRGHTQPNISSNITDRYYSPQEWSQLSSEQQQKVRELRADRDKKRGLQAIDTNRNVRPKSEPTNSNPTAQQNVTSISAVTSQRSDRNLS